MKITLELDTVKFENMERNTFYRSIDPSHKDFVFMKSAGYSERRLIQFCIGTFPAVLIADVSWHNYPMVKCTGMLLNIQGD